MGNVAQSILERVFVQLQTSFDTALHSAGTATVAGGDYMRHTKCSLIHTQAEIPSTDKTGSISATRGAAGARGGTWSLEWEARPSGAAGTAPDCDPILAAAFGVAGTVVASTSVTYNLSSLIKAFSLYRFRQPSTMLQQLGLGCVCQELSFSFEQQANSMFRASGTCFNVPDSENFATEVTIGKGGLTSFPAEPGSPTSAGDPVNGLTGTATLDGSTEVQIKSANVRLVTAEEIPRDRLFQGQFGSTPERDILGVFIDMSIIDEDIAAVEALYTKARSRTLIPILLEAGSVAGSRILWTMANCQLPEPALDDSARKWAANFQGIRAYPSSLTALDEVTCKFY